MNPQEKKLLTILKTIEGSGTFSTSGAKKMTNPGLRMEGLGEIGLPLNPIQAKEIIKLAKKAPFGKGSLTITDTSVRSAWEVDANQLSFQNEEWEKFLGKILKKVKKGLGIGKQKVQANLYKMLLYEKGDFFLPHQDSEKEKGMFATLVVGLPSAHAGGELYVRFDGRENSIDFSSAASSYEIPFAAFYADCEHEIKPVTSGYRICLVYNLVQPSQAKKINVPQFTTQASEMAEVLKALEKKLEHSPKAVLLGHQYTPTNFSLNKLKLHDRPRAEALIQAAEKAGYFARLGLVTCYQMGELEGSTNAYSDYGYGSRYSYYEEEEVDGTMGEIYEEELTIENWSKDPFPTLGELNISEENILAEKEIAEGDPIDQAAEGFTGNEGMTMEYWYHYGAVVLWPRSRHANTILQASVEVRLEWLAFYMQRWEDAALNSKEYARQLVAGLAEIDFGQKSYSELDFSPVASALVKFEDEAFLKKYGGDTLANLFDKIKVDNWLALFQQYNPDIFGPILQKVAATDDMGVIHHLLKVLEELDHIKSPPMEAFVSEQVAQFPVYLSKVKLHELLELPTRFYYGDDIEKRKNTMTNIIEMVLGFTCYWEVGVGWVQKVLEAVKGPLPRDYANEVLVPILLTQKYNESKLTKALYRDCLEDLKRRIALKPQPPTTWTRTVPKSRYYKEMWETLRPFLESPTQQVFNYQQNERYRNQMESAINAATIDLKTETIRKGRPYTLRVTKTQSAYDLALKNWKEDVVLLNRLGKMG